MQPTGLSRTPVRHEPCGFFFLDMHLNIAVFLKQHYWANNCVRHFYLTPYVRQYTADWYKSAFLVLHLNIAVLSNALILVLHPNIAFLCAFYEWQLYEKALAYSKTEREPQRRRERECRKERKSVLLRQSRQSRRTRQKYASRWHTLNTAIDKWHNESTVPNVREPSVSPLRSKWGETREEGVVIHLTCSHSAYSLCVKTQYWDV